MAEDLGRMLLGRYRLMDPLGRGGMGTVWRAYDERLGRRVAVKELRLPEGLDAEQRRAWTARLDREARAAARLRHPGIVTVHDLVTTGDGQPWIIMELVPGPSLADVLAEHGPLSPDRAAALGARVLDALRAAHRAGIVHRDIKPANVLLEGDRVVLTDFGIAAVEGDATLTRSGALLGTPAYMSPEQVRGLPAGAESDLWSLGATLHTAVEGRPPFSGTSPGAVFVAVATEEPAPAPHAGPLAPVIHGLMRKNAAERMGLDQALEMLNALASQQAGFAPAPAGGQGSPGDPPGPVPGPAPNIAPPPQGPPAHQAPWQPPPPYVSRSSRHIGRWPGFLIAGAAALLMATVLLPWQTVTVSGAGLPHIPPTTSSGLGSAWGWGMLLCAAAAAALGVLGGVRSKGRLAATAAAPALVGLLMLAIAAVLPQIKKPAIPNAKVLPPTLVHLASSHTKVSMGFGWYLAALLTLLVIGLSIVSLVLATRD
ncbi:serine/threonine-protein kinase [Actinomadura sp. K4S16]|uniref:serine/threonine-protein kinase n=1 Tax=Actinomadura sp. K4S16 TaxID=1316147 RepID=UPI00190F8764|nr:serine/threonine-protein kinase [Actinomadura sp. K4S16]